MAKEPEDSFTTFITTLKKITGVEALAIRMREKNDYLYFALDGFPKGHVEHEFGVLSSGGEVECLCGRVLTGSIDKTKPYYTEFGSFWTGSINDVGDELVQADGPKTRGFCIVEGFNTIALVPIKSRGVVIGLLQLCDKRQNLLEYEDILFLEDISESVSIALTRAEQYRFVKATSDRYKSLLESMTDAVCVIKDKKIVYSNYRLLELLGYLFEEEILNREFNFLVVEDEQERLNQYHKLRSRGLAVPSHFETRLLRKTGEVVEVESDITSIEWEGDKASLIINRDITVQKNAECIINQKKLVYPTLLKHASSLIMAKDVDTVNNITLEALNVMYPYMRASLIDFVKDNIKSIDESGNLFDSDLFSFVPSLTDIIHVATTGTTQIVNDVRAYPEYIEYQKNFTTLSVINVPVNVDGKVRALLRLETDYSNAFLIDDKVILEIMTRQIAAAFKQITLSEDERRDKEKIISLHEGVRKLTLALSEDEVWHIALSTLRDHLGYPKASIGIIKENSLLFKGEYSLIKNEDLSIPLDGPSPSAKSIRSEKSTIVKDVRLIKGNVTRHIGPDGEPIFKSMLLVPVMLKGEPISLFTAHDVKPDSFHEEDVRLVEILAQHSAAVVARIRSEKKGKDKPINYVYPLMDQVTE